MGIIGVTPELMKILYGWIYEFFSSVLLVMACRVLCRVSRVQALHQRVFRLMRHAGDVLKYAFALCFDFTSFTEEAWLTDGNYGTVTCR